MQPAGILLNKSNIPVEAFKVAPFLDDVLVTHDSCRRAVDQHCSSCGDPTLNHIKKMLPLLQTIGITEQLESPPDISVFRRPHGMEYISWDKRHKTIRGVGNIPDTGTRTGGVEVDHSFNMAVCEDEVVRCIVVVTDDFMLVGVGKHHLPPRRWGRAESCSRIMETPEESGCFNQDLI